MEADALVRELARAEVMMVRQDVDPNPFFDRAGYFAHIDTQEQGFEEMPREQQAR